MDDKPKQPTLAEELLLLYRGIVESEGCRRLSVVLGGLWRPSRSGRDMDCNAWCVSPRQIRFRCCRRVFCSLGLTQLIGWVVEGVLHKGKSK